MNKNSKKPIPVLVSGALGRMGSEVVNTVLNSTDCELVAAIDINEKNNGSNISELLKVKDCDVFVSNDFEGINGEKPNFKKSKIEIKSSREDFSFSKIRTSKNTIDVRGLRVHEAEMIIEEKIRKFHGPLWIVHGIGTGKLKQGLRKWLSGLNYVDNIEDAANNECGPGCSIVWIK